MNNVLEKLRKVYINSFANPYSIFIIGFLVLILPYFFRGFVLHGQESYFFHRISNFIIENNIPNYDFLSFGGRAFLYGLGSPLFLVFINLLFRISLINLLIFIPPLLGIFSLTLFYFILKSFKLSKNVLSFACYILILSPIFLYSFTHFTSFTIPLFLNLLGFFLVLKERKIFRYISILTYFMLSFFGFIHVFFGLLFLLFYFHKINKLKDFAPYSFIFLFIIYFNNHFVEFGLDVMNYKFYELFFYFGGEYGLSVFLLFLAFFGLVRLWQEKYKNLNYYLLLILNVLLLVLSIKYLIYFNLMLCVLSASGLKYIYKFKWDSLLIRNLTLILLMAGIVFSGVSFLIMNSQLDPSEEIYDSLVFLGKMAGPRDVVLSHEKYGIYINSISKRKNFIDLNYAYAPRLDLRLFYLNKVFYSRDLTKVLEIFNEFQVSHILITPEMKKGLVWNTDNEGLLFLLKNNPDNFNSIYNKNGFEIWRVS